MNSTNRLASSLVFATATAFSMSAYSQPTFSWLEQALSRWESGEHHERDRESHHRRSAFVGMWITTLYIGPYEGPNTKKLDIAIQQVSSDGNEVMSSALFSPALGNVCMGVWKHLGNNSFKLRHTGWGFDPTTGAFVAINPLDVLLTVSESGKTYSGTYTAKTFDLQGKELKDLAAEGDIKATRFEVEGPDASIDEVAGGKAPSVKSLSSESPTRRTSC